LEVGDDVGATRRGLGGCREDLLVCRGLLEHDRGTLDPGRTRWGVGSAELTEQRIRARRPVNGSHDADADVVLTPAAAAPHLAVVLVELDVNVAEPQAVTTTVISPQGALPAPLSCCASGDESSHFPLATGR
jgi:hypothetical protein